VFVTALPHSTAEVERTFSRLNNNKNKLRDCPAVCSLEAMMKFSENFPGDFEVNQRLSIYMSKQGKHILQNWKILKLLVLSLMRLFPCELQPAGELQGLCLRFTAKRAGVS